jgi:hypothetical protein
MRLGGDPWAAILGGPTRSYLASASSDESVMVYEDLVRSQHLGSIMRPLDLLVASCQSIVDSITQAAYFGDRLEYFHLERQLLILTDSEISHLCRFINRKTGDVFRVSRTNDDERVMLAHMVGDPESYRTHVLRITWREW